MEVDLVGGENQAEHRKEPIGPVSSSAARMETIHEVTVICEYLDELQGGTNPIDIARREQKLACG